jgi:hypothetical protein
VVDFDAALRDDPDPSRLRTAYDSSDHVHPSTAGYRAMGSYIDLAQLRGRACAASPTPRGRTVLTLSARMTAARTVRAAGRLTRPRGVACPRGSRVDVRAVGGGRTTARRSTRLSATCRYSTTLTLPRTAARVLSVRAAFPGTRTLAPARRSVTVRR